MAYDRFDTRDAPREHSRWSNDRDSPDRGGRGDSRRSEGRDERGFFERAGDEVASWFGDDDAERRRREDQMRDERDQHARGRSNDDHRGRDHDRNREPGRDSWYETRGLNERGGFADRDYNPNWRRELSGPGNRERDWDRERRFDRGRDYRPMTGDYGRSERFSGSGRSSGGPDRSNDREDSPWDRDDYRRTSRAGTSDWSDRSRHEDPHYGSWRQRHMDELDRDYDDYRHENRSRFESDFGSWRERRQQKRALLGQIHEHMEVVGDDEKHVGTVDKVAGDRIILAKSDPDSGGVHHSLSCSDIGRVEGDRVYLDCSAEEAKQRWRDESRNRALFEREDQGEMGPRSLNRSFEGTYR
jgi:hypothetical protein